MNDDRRERLTRLHALTGEVMTGCAFTAADAWDRDDPELALACGDAGRALGTIFALLDARLWPE